MNTHACILVTQCNLFDHYYDPRNNKRNAPLKTLISMIFFNYNNFIQTTTREVGEVYHVIQFNNTD